MVAVANGSFPTFNANEKCGARRAGLSAMVVALLANFVDAQGTTVNCEPGSVYLNNERDQTPCMVFAILSSGCNNDAVSISSLPMGSQLVYLNPPNKGVGPSSMCTCNTVTYSIMSACSICQNQTYMTWDNWSGPCSEKTLGQFPAALPSGASVPAWAFAPLPAGGVFNGDIAREVVGPDSSVAVLPTSSSASALPQTNTKAVSPTSPSSTRIPSDPFSSPSSSDPSTVASVTSTSTKSGSSFEPSTVTSPVSTSTPASISSTISPRPLLQSTRTATTSPSGASPTSGTRVSREHIIIISGAVVGVVVSITIFLLALVFWMRRRSGRNHEGEQSVRDEAMVDILDITSPSSRPRGNTARTVQARLRRVGRQDIPTGDAVSNRGSSATLLQRLRSLSSRWPSMRNRIPTSDTTSWNSRDATVGSNANRNTSADAHDSVPPQLGKRHRSKLSSPTQSFHLHGSAESLMIHQRQSDVFSDDETVVEASSEIGVVGSEPEVDSWTLTSLDC